MKALIDDITGYLFEYRQSRSANYRSMAIARRFNLEMPVITEDQACAVFYLLGDDPVQPIIIDIDRGLYDK